MLVSCIYKCQCILLNDYHVVNLAQSREQTRAAFRRESPQRHAKAGRCSETRYRAFSSDLQYGLSEPFIKNQAICVTSAEHRHCRSSLMRSAYDQHAFHSTKIAELHGE